MPLNYMEHFLLQTEDIEASKDWYVKMLDRRVLCCLTYISVARSSFDGAIMPQKPEVDRPDAAS